MTDMITIPRSELQQALDALKHLCLYTMAIEGYDREKIQPPINALKKRLAQPEPPCKTGSQCVGGKCMECAQPEPEPVAWMFLDDLERFEEDETFCEVYSVARMHVTRGETVPLYTAPPQREWQGLMDEEKHALIAMLAVTGDMNKIVNTIEAKLKEKNDG